MIILHVFFLEVNLLLEWVLGVLSVEDDNLLSTAALKLLHRLTAAAACDSFISGFNLRSLL